MIALVHVADSLFCIAEVSDDLIAAVRAGHYISVSSSYYQVGASHNPVPEINYLKHIGFLGARTPAIIGMQPISFSETDADVAVCFAAYGSASPSSGSREAELLTAAIDLSTACPGLSIIQAAIEVDRATISRRTR